MRRYLIVMEVESDIELDRSDPPESSPRWRLIDVYPNLTSENYPEGDWEAPHEVNLVEITTIKDMGEVIPE